MTAAFTIIEPGLCLTVQDAGREGFQHLGIAPGGALDPVALRIANMLAGNIPGAAALEALYAGPTIRVEAERLIIAAAGAQCAIRLTRANGEIDDDIRVGESVEARRGDILRFGPLKGASCLYIALGGGVDAPEVMGSRSTYLRGGFGGLEGRALKAGDTLSCNPAASDAVAGLCYSGAALNVKTRLRVLPGAQMDMFDAAQRESFMAQAYTVSRGDRMALRLMGDTLPGATSCSIISDAVQDGAVQIAGDGLPIVMLRERQTTGGYPKIATIISADLPALGRLAPGMSVSFELVTMAEAMDARRAHNETMRNIGEFIHPRRRQTFAPDTGWLAQCNLISGVWDGADHETAHDHTGY